MKTEGMLPTASAGLVFDRAVLDEKLLSQLKGRRVLLQVEDQPHTQAPYSQDLLGKQEGTNRQCFSFTADEFQDQIDAGEIEFDEEEEETE